ncbi:MAG: hypothetical protein C4K48_04065 [Candidatus Thorarchaeota archaeon]|nr:MAG: hypothetical protein C4K48_04065 [Candidatus Thorarchaeota archaeon]
MRPVISKCGNLCSICPWGHWIRKNQSPAEWESYVEDAKKYVGFTPTENPCQGCQTANERLAKDVGIHNFIRGCYARKCALHNRFENCAFCSRYPCAKIREMNRSDRVEETEKRLGESIPDDKYESFIRPFEGKKTLDEIRTGLGSDQIREVETVDLIAPKTTEFPQVKRNKMNTTYMALHDALSKVITSSLGLSDIDTIAGQELFIARREVLLRLLWIIARYGTFKDSKISVDSITINANKGGTSGFPTTEAAWGRWIDILSRTGIVAEIEFSTQERSKITTPTGWLRERIPDTGMPAWFLKVSFDDTLGGIASLKTLQSYAQTLDEKKGKSAFATFKKADMLFLQDA